MRAMGALVAGLVSGGVLLVGPPALRAQVTGAEVSEIRFEGNSAFSSDQLRQLILTRSTECRAAVLGPFCLFGADWAQDPFLLSPIALPADAARLRLYYGARGYRYAQVDTALAYTSDSSEVTVTFAIQEDQPVRVTDLDISGVDDLGAEVLAGLATRVGSPLDRVALEADQDTLRYRLQNQGYAHADVFRGSFIPNSDPYGAEVTLDVFPGTAARIGPVEVVGNERLDEVVIRRMLPFREGTVYRRDDVLAAQRNLYGLELVRSATVEADLSHMPDSIVPVTVRITEGDQRRWFVGGGVSTADCLNSEVRWTNRNAGGGGRRLQLRSSVSNVAAERLHDVLCPQAGTDEFGVVNWSLGADFTQPWVFGVRNALNASVFYERQTLKDVFVRRAVGASLTLTRSLGRGAAMALSFRPQFAQLAATDLFFCTSFLVCEPSDVEELERFNWLSPIALSASRTRTDQLFNPTRGTTLLADIEVARDWTGSAFGYDRALGEAGWYRALGRDAILATRLRAGVVRGREFTGSDVGQSGIIHPQKRMFAGGANSVRGYAQSQLGPRVLTVGVGSLIAPTGDADPPCTPQTVIDLSCSTDDLQADAFFPRPTGGSGLLVANAELRIRLTRTTFQGVLFFDAGQVWNDYGQATFGELQLSPGMGVRYFSPIGPIRVDVGYRVAGGEMLRVVSEQIRPYDPATDPESSQVRAPADDTVLPWVKTGELALLVPRRLFDDSRAWSWSRFQLHISIGQAF